MAWLCHPGVFDTPSDTTSYINVFAALLPRNIPIVIMEYDQSDLTKVTHFLMDVVPTNSFVNGRKPNIVTSGENPWRSLFLWQDYNDPNHSISQNWGWILVKGFQ